MPSQDASKRMSSPGKAMKHLRVFHSVFQLDPGLLLLFGLKQLYLVERERLRKAINVYVYRYSECACRV